MPSSLYIFVSSHIPDGYINVICHCIEYFAIENVILLDILHDNGKKLEREDFLSLLKERIITQFNLLSEGRYLKYSSVDNLNPVEINISDAQKKRYLQYTLKIPHQNISFETISYNELNSKIQKYVENPECYFDITTTSKTNLVDVLMVILSKHLRQIYTFELLTQTRNFNDRDLIHNLELGITYKYTNLTNTEYTRDKIVIDSLESTQKIEIINSISSNIDKIANNFAVTILVLYSFIVLIAIVGISYLVYSKSWDWLEPKTYLFGLPLIPYLINLLFSLFSNKDFSLKPTYLKTILVEYRKKRLKKIFNL